MLLAYYLLFQEEFIGICCLDAFCFRYVTVVVPVMFHWWSYQLSNYIMTGPCSSFYFTSWGRCFLTAVLVRLGNEANQSSLVALHSVFSSRDPIVALRYTPSTAKKNAFINQRNRTVVGDTHNVLVQYVDDCAPNLSGVVRSSANLQQKQNEFQNIPMSAGRCLLH
jgi:hypothetical protein